MKIHAAFIIAEVASGQYAATTRPNSDAVGLPGGKLDGSESPNEALHRECLEEGWKLEGGRLDYVCRQTIEGRTVVWYALRNGKVSMLDTFKEQGRIRPVVASRCDLRGLGNPEAFQKFFALLEAQRVTY